MKALLILMAVLIGSLFVIVLIGSILPKHHTATRRMLLKATPDQVFALISGPQDWRTDLKEHKFFEDGGRPMVRETDKHDQTITYEIVESSPPNLLKRRIVDKNLPFGGSWTWNIQPQADGCSITIVEDGEVYNPVFRFVSRFIMGHTRTTDNYLAMLQQVVSRDQK